MSRPWPSVERRAKGKINHCAVILLFFKNLFSSLIPMKNKPKYLGLYEYRWTEMSVM
jgi:hypothetical protein